MPRTYVNNAQNRSLGRVGMPVGSMPVSRGSSGSGSSYGSSSGSRSASGYSGGTKTYVDNAYNRSLGRVGMEHGSAVVSRSGSSYGSSFGSSGASGNSGGTKTYVDNAYNRSLGRVGMEHGSAVVSRSGSSHGSLFGNSGASGNSGGTKTYVDNAYNRSLGRVGMEHGSAVASRSGSASWSGNSARTYVDNASNRSLGRVGMPIGSMPVSRGSFGTDCPGTFDQCFSASPVNVYKDNAMNRRLGRVGRPLGSMPHSKSYSISRSSQNVYVDNYMNRALGRVGMPLGSMPVSSKSKQTQAIRDIYQQMKRNPEKDVDLSQYNDSFMETVHGDQTCEVVIDLINRLVQVKFWQDQTGTKDQPKTSAHLLQRYEGTNIDFEELDLQKKIGQGGFGDVYFAKWKGSVVAVKKLRVQRVSKKRLKEFTDELMVFCTLEHPSIVKFIGACITTPKLAIVMEYMQSSLFEALHVQEDREFSEEDRLSIIKQVLDGLEYLHGRRIAHCDLKSLNILLNMDDNVVAKLTDFGLSMMRAENESSVSAADCVRNIGTPRYSAPEVLRGELLNRKDMLKADMYSAGLIVFEILFEEEPFASLKYAQLCKHVGEGYTTPDISNNIRVSPKLLSEMEACWSRNADERPTASSFLSTVKSLPRLWDN